MAKDIASLKRLTIRQMRKIIFANPIKKSQIFQYVKSFNTSENTNYPREEKTEFIEMKYE